MAAARKPITADGYTLPLEMEDIVLADLAGLNAFTAGAVSSALHRAGVPTEAVEAKHGPWGPAGRLADRILQRERRAGRLTFRKGRWWRS